VAFSFACSDDESGIATCSGPVTLSAEGQDQSVDGQAVDNAGNTAGTTVAGINIDLTPPTTSGDSLSGIATCTGPHTVTTEGKDQAVAGAAVDKAGNSATDQAKVSIDKSKPTISGAADCAPNATGWYKADVTVTFSCADTLSGLASCTGPLTLGEGDNQSASGTAVDKAGNSAATTISPIRVDKTAPIITWNGGRRRRLLLRFRPGSPDLHRHSALSGPNGCTVSGYSAAVGSQTMTANGSDVGGRQAWFSVVYHPQLEREMTIRDLFG
jgi:hypothetical protein